MVLGIMVCPITLSFDRLSFIVVVFVIGSIFYNVLSDVVSSGGRCDSNDVTTFFFVAAHATTTLKLKQVLW